MPQTWPQKYRSYYLLYLAFCIKLDGIAADVFVVVVVHTYPVQFGVLLLSSCQQLVALSEVLSLRY